MLYDSLFTDLVSGLYIDDDDMMFIFIIISAFRDYFNDRTFGLHLKIMEELIQRDKNHPSVVMWSVANEPISEYEHVADYLKYVF